MLVSKLRALLGAFVLPFLAIPAVAQKVPQLPTPVVSAAPPALLAQFDVMVGTLQTLTLPLHLPNQLWVDVVLAGQTARLDLLPHDVRAPGFQLIERGPAGDAVVPTPPSVTYRGTVQGDDGSVVAASLRDGSLTAWIRLANDEVWVVQAVREVQPNVGPGLHVVYRATDSRNLQYTCGVPHGAGGVMQPGPQTDVVYACQLAIEADFPFYQANGSNSTTTQNDITSVVNAMDVIYRRDVQVSLQVTTILVNTTTDPYTSSSAGTLLGQVANYWNANRGGVVRDVAHMFTGRPMGQVSNGAVGIAYVGVVCSLGSAYGVSQSRFSSNWNHRVAVTAHEIGHNFNGAHCDGASPCNIMCSGVGGCSNNQTSFGATEQGQIIGFRNGLGCLTVTTTVPAITSVSSGSVKTFRPTLLTVNGSGFTGVNSATVGGQPVTTAISVLSDTQLRFTPPAGLPLGWQLMTVTNSAGTSNSFLLLYTGSDPCDMTATSAVLGGQTVYWGLGGLAGDLGFLLVSLQNTTSPFQGLPLLDGFSTLWMGGLDARGMGAYSIGVPAGVLAGVRVYSQLLVVNPATLQARSTSAVLSTWIIN